MISRISKVDIVSQDEVIGKREYISATRQESIVLTGKQRIVYLTGQSDTKKVA